MEEQVVVVGLGVVGLTTSLRLCEKGRSVLGIDSSPLVRKNLKEGRCNNSLRKLLHKHLGHSLVLGDYNDIGNTEKLVLCINTPTYKKKIYLLNLYKALNVLKNFQPRPIVIRSTVIPGTMEYISREMLPSWPLAYYPEFLRQEQAWSDSLNPSLKIYATLETTGEWFESLFQDSFLKISIRVAEYIKYMNNSFHALKVAFANEMATLGNRLNVDMEECYKIFITDNQLNISPAYLRPGKAFAGACLEKDLKALEGLMRECNLLSPLIDSIVKSNDLHKERLSLSEQKKHPLEIAP